MFLSKTARALIVTLTVFLFSNPIFAASLNEALKDQAAQATLAQSSNTDAGSDTNTSNSNNINIKELPDNPEGVSGKLITAVTDYFIWIFKYMFVYSYDAFSDNWLINGVPIFNSESARSFWNFFLGIGIIVFILSLVWLGIEMMTKSESLEFSRARLKTLITLAILMFFSAFAIDFSSSVVGKVIRESLLGIQFKEASLQDIFGADTQYSSLLNYGYAPSPEVGNLLEEKIKTATKGQTISECINSIGVGGFVWLLVQKGVISRAAIALGQIASTGVGNVAGSVLGVVSLVGIGYNIADACNLSKDISYPELFVLSKQLEYGFIGVPFLVFLLLGLTIEGFVIYMSSIIIALIAAFSPVWFIVAFVHRDYLPIYAWLAMFFRFKITVLVIIILQMFMLRFLKDAIPLVSGSIPAQIAVEVVLTIIFAYILTMMIYNSVKYAMFDALNLGGIQTLGFAANIAKKFGMHFDHEGSKNLGEVLDKYAARAKELGQKGRQRAQEEEALIEGYIKKIQAPEHGKEFDVSSKLKDIAKNRFLEINPLKSIEYNPPKEHIIKYAPEVSISEGKSDTIITVNRQGMFGTSDILETVQNIKNEVLNKHSSAFQELYEKAKNAYVEDLEEKMDIINKQMQAEFALAKNIQEESKKIVEQINFIKQEGNESNSQSAVIKDLEAKLRQNKEQLKIIGERYIALKSQIMSKHELEDIYKKAENDVESVLNRIEVTDTATGIKVRIPHLHCNNKFIDIASSVTDMINSYSPLLEKSEILVYKHGENYVSFDKKGRIIKFEELPDNARIIGSYNMHRLIGLADELLKERRTARGQEKKSQRNKKAPKEG